MEKFIKTLFPLSIRDRFYSVDCTLGYKATVGGRSHIEGGNDVLTYFSVGCNAKYKCSVVSIQNLTKIYRSWLKKCDYHEIQQYSDQS